MAASSALFSPPHSSFIFKTKPLHLIPAQNSFPPFHTPMLKFPASRKTSHYLDSSGAIRPTTTEVWKISASNGSFWLSEASPVESSQEIVSATSDDGVSTIISALLFIAFVGLSILTIGVIYIAVTDFLTKREREKFEKEEAAKKKKSGKKGKVRARARAGPRGFGQKIDEDEDLDEAD